MATLTSTFLTAGQCPFSHTMITVLPTLILTLKKRRETFEQELGKMIELERTQVPEFPAFLKVSPALSKALEDDLSTLPSSSLREIHSNVSSDFFRERQEGGFVHALEVVDGEQQCLFELETVRSEVLSEPFDTDSTESSFGEHDTRFSEVQDVG